MDTPRFRAILRIQLGWKYAEPWTARSDKYVDRQGEAQFAPNPSAFDTSEQILEFLRDKGCEVEPDEI